MSLPTYLAQSGEDCDLLVLAAPRASRSGIVGEHDGRLKIRLAAPPVDGEANAELIRFLAKLLALPRSRVVLTQGDTGKRKTVRLKGIKAEAVNTRLGGT